MIAFIITFVCIGILLVCGLVVNIYLYSHGLFRGRHVGDWASDDEYLAPFISGRYDISSSYTRRWIIYLAVAILVIALILLSLSRVLGG